MSTQALIWLVLVALVLVTPAIQAYRCSDEIALLEREQMRQGSPMDRWLCRLTRLRLLAMIGIIHLLLAMILWWAAGAIVLMAAMAGAIT